MPYLALRFPKVANHIQIILHDHQLFSTIVANNDNFDVSDEGESVSTLF